VLARPDQAVHRRRRPAIYDAAGRLLDAELDLAETPAERVAVRQKQVGLSKEVEATTKHFSEAGNSKVTPADVEKARYARLTAEINLLRAQKDLPTPKRSRLRHPRRNMGWCPHCLGSRKTRLAERLLLAPAAQMLTAVAGRSAGTLTGVSLDHAVRLLPGPT
jgi:hypothetical protein